MTENKIHLYNGGTIEEAEAMDFQGVDQHTGAARPVHLEDRVVVTYGRKKQTLNGAMVTALHTLYARDDAFRTWCSRCK